MSEAKDANVDRLTPEQLVFRLDIWRKLHSHWLPDEADRQLMDLREHLQSLSQEAVREETLECEAELTGILHRELLDTQLVTVEQWNTEIAPALSKLRNSIERALKREPNAALGMEHPNAAGAGPAPAAPDVAEGDRLLQSPGASDD